MRLKHVAVLVVVVAGLFSACGRSAQPLNVVARDYSFSGVGQTVSGGAVEVAFRNEGKADHELVFLDIGGASFEEFRKGFPAVFRGGPFPKFMKAVTGIGEIRPGKSVSSTITLPKGNYLMMCALDDAPGKGHKTLKKPHYELGMHQNVTVEGPDTVNAHELDAPGGTFHAQDYTFVAPPGLAAGKNEFAFVNDGPDQWHFMSMMVFPKGTTAKQAEAAFGKLVKGGEDAPPPKGVPLPKDFLETGPFSPGMGQTFTATFETGRTYLGACFISDKKGGPPHAIAHHMYKAFTVP